jgi:hypothetical protein
VLKGQCIRSNAGLYYESAAEFVETLTAIEKHRWLNTSLGRNGRQFFRDNYDWPVIERKYLDMFTRLQSAAAPPAAEHLPGWIDRRRDNLPPAKEVLATLPVGPALAGRATASASAETARRRA